MSSIYFLFFTLICLKHTDAIQCYSCVACMPLDPAARETPNDCTLCMTLSSYRGNTHIATTLVCLRNDEPCPERPPELQGVRSEIQCCNTNLCNNPSNTLRFNPLIWGILTVFYCFK